MRHRYAVVVQDLYSYWIQCFPTKKQDCRRKRHIIRCEFIRACEDVCWNRDKSTRADRSFQKMSGEKPLNASEDGTNWQPESHHLGQDLGTPFDGTVIPFGAFQRGSYSRECSTTSPTGKVRRCNINVFLKRERSGYVRSKIHTWLWFLKSRTTKDVEIK